MRSDTSFKPFEASFFVEEEADPFLELLEIELRTKIDEKNIPEHSRNDR